MFYKIWRKNLKKFNENNKILYEDLKLEEEKLNNSNYYIISENLKSCIIF